MLGHDQGAHHGRGKRSDKRDAYAEHGFRGQRSCQRTGQEVRGQRDGGGGQIDRGPGEPASGFGCHGVE